MKKTIAALLALVMLFSLCACGSDPGDSGESAKTRTITDACGREVVIPAQVKSVICVGVATLRFTTYLDALDLIVGVEENELGVTSQKPFSYLHQDLWATLPQTGNNGETYDEEIIAANPDVIVAYMDKDAADAFQEKTGIPVVTIAHVEGILDQNVYDTINLLGEVYGRQERAKELTDYLDGIKADISSRVAAVSAEDIPSVYVSCVSFKGFHGFEGTEANYGPLKELGAVNIADSTGQTSAFDMDIEEVLRQDPDYIFVDTAGMDILNEQYDKNPDFFDSFTAVKENRVYSQISFRYNATNVEMALADMYYMATVIYPEAFSDIDINAKANEIFKTFLGADDYCKTLSDDGYTFGSVTIGK